MLDINNILKQFHDFTIKNSNQLILFINNKENAKIVPKKKYQNLFDIEFQKQKLANSTKQILKKQKNIETVNLSSKKRKEL